MASCYTDHIQGDESISVPLSIADTSHATLSSSLTQSLVSLDFTTSAHLLYKPKTRKSKFYGSRHTLKIQGKKSLDSIAQPKSLKPIDQVIPLPVSTKTVDTVAGRKLVYYDEEKSKLFSLEVCDDNDDDGVDDDVTYRDHYAVPGNYIIDLSSFSSILKEMAVCRSCEEGSLELFDCGEKASCPSLLKFRCDSCHYSRSF